MGVMILNNMILNNHFSYHSHFEAKFKVSVEVYEPWFYCCTDSTVSARHARIKKKEDNLLVTDLDSTNGTFINEKRLRPGVVSTAPPGSLITFGIVCHKTHSIFLTCLVFYSFSENISNWFICDIHSLQICMEKKHFPNHCPFHTRNHIFFIVVSIRLVLKFHVKQLKKSITCLFPGDIHLAIFRVSKLENVETPSSPEGSETEPDSSPAQIKETSNWEICCSVL